MSLHRTWTKRVAWLVGLWCGGVLALGAAALVLKWAMRAAGLSD